MIAKTKKATSVSRHIAPRRKGSIHHAPPAIDEVSHDQPAAQSALRCLIQGDHSPSHFANALPAHIFSRMVELEQFRCLAPISDAPVASGTFPTKGWADALAELRSPSLPAVFLGQKNLFQSLADAYEASVSIEEAERFSLLCEIAPETTVSEYLLSKTGRSSRLAHFGAEFTNQRFPSISLRGWSALSAQEKQLIQRSLQKSGVIGAADQFTQGLAQSMAIDSIPMPPLFYFLEHACSRALANAAQEGTGLQEFRHRFPTGWAAVEISSADSASIESAIGLAEELISSTGLGVVFFSPKLTQLSFHEERALKRAVSAFTGSEAARFIGTDLWAQVNFLRQSRLVISETASTRMVSAALSLPRLSRIPQQKDDQNALVDFCETWERVDVEMLVEEDSDALSEQLAEAYHQPVSHWDTEVVQQYALNQWQALDL